MMKVLWSVLVAVGKDGVMGYVDSDWNINISYTVLGLKHPIIAEIDTLFHELGHWVIRNRHFNKVWDKIFRMVNKYVFNFVVTGEVLYRTAERLQVKDFYINIAKQA